MNRADGDKMPIIERYRGCPIFDYQDRARIEATVKPQIDAVVSMSDPIDLYAHAVDPHHCPESRLLAAAKIEALAEGGRPPSAVDVKMLRASTAGLGGMDFACYRFYCSGLEYPSVYAPKTDLSSFDVRPEHQQRRMKEANEQRWARAREAWLEAHPAAR